MINTYGGLTELVQLFAYRGCSHWRKGAASHIIDSLAVSLAYPNGEEGGILLVQIFTTCLRGA